MNATGYSVCAQDYLLAMLKVNPNQDLKVSYVNPTPMVGISASRRQLFETLRVRPDIKPAMALFHTIPMLYRRPDVDRCIGFAIFETINPPKMWIKNINSMDRVVTASDFNKGVFEQSGVTVPIAVVPHCFDQLLFNEKVKPIGRYDRFTFLSMGTWKQRKNWESIIRAFYDGFENNDKVCLLIKTDKPEKLQEMVSIIKRSKEFRTKDTAPIYSEEKICCEFEDIPAIMKKGDVYVCPSLGEGFGLPGLHAMALGIPLITTRYGGCLQYAKPDLCTYVEPKTYRTIPSMDGIPQFTNCIWPMISVEDLRDAMRSVFQNDQREKARKAYQFAHSNFTYDVVGRQLIEAIS